MNDLDTRYKMALAKLGNPYAKEQTYPVESYPEADLSLRSFETAKRPPISDRGSVNQSYISKAVFRRECRRIFAKYEPLGARAIRPTFRDFIEQHQEKSPEVRAAILRELERYDLGEINVILNREREQDLVAKLTAISQSFLR